MLAEAERAETLHHYIMKNSEFRLDQSHNSTLTSEKQDEHLLRIASSHMMLGVGHINLCEKSDCMMQFTTTNTHSSGPGSDLGTDSDYY